VTTTSPPLVRVFHEKNLLPMGRPQPGVAHDPRDDGQGQICKLINRELSGSEDISLSVVRVSPGDYHIKHYHPNGSQWYYFIEGSSIVHVDGANVRATAGSIVYVPPGVVHAIKNDTGQRAELLAGISAPDYRDIGRVYVEPETDDPSAWVVVDEHPLLARVSDEAFVRFIDTDPGGTNAVIDPRDQGSIVKLVTRRLMGSQDVSVSVARVYAGDYHLKHHHPYGSQAYYILSGQCLAHIDGQDLEVSPGTSIYLPPGTVHSINNTSEETLELVSILSKPEYAEVGLVYDE
jgi:quercetin dioxygenase-like cupin family protein